MICPRELFEIRIKWSFSNSLGQILSRSTYLLNEGFREVTGIKAVPEGRTPRDVFIALQTAPGGMKVFADWAVELKRANVA